MTGAQTGHGSRRASPGRPVSSVADPTTGAQVAFRSRARGSAPACHLVAPCIRSPTSRRSSSGLLQGASELFPVSSLGHSVVLPRLLGWDIHQNDDYFLTFLVATHLATALVLLGFFWRRLGAHPRAACGRSLRDREIAPADTDAKLGWLLVVGTIPAGLLGLLLEHALRNVFASAQSAAFFLMLNGVMLFGAEALRRRAPGPGRRRGRRRRADRRTG